jgi:hypothetical protein
VHTEEELCAALQRNGFQVHFVEGHLGSDKEDSDRITFFAQKGEQK